MLHLFLLMASAAQSHYCYCQLHHGYWLGSLQHEADQDVIKSGIEPLPCFTRNDCWSLSDILLHFAEQIEGEQMTGTCLWSSLVHQVYSLAFAQQQQLLEGQFQVRIWQACSTAQQDFG